MRQRANGELNYRITEFESNYITSQNLEDEASEVVAALFFFFYSSLTGNSEIHGESGDQTPKCCLLTTSHTLLAHIHTIAHTCALCNTYIHTL